MLSGYRGTLRVHLGCHGACMYGYMCVLACVCACEAERFELSLKVFVGVFKKGGSVGGKLVREEVVMWREKRMSQNVLTRPSQRKRGPAKATGTRQAAHWCARSLEVCVCPCLRVTCSLGSLRQGLLSVKTKPQFSAQPRIRNQGPACWKSTLKSKMSVVLHLEEPN